MIELKSDQLWIKIDTKGAYITEFECEGVSIFQKKHYVEIEGTQKARGGCHVCYPQFGNAGPYDLPTHGFGREFEWQVREQLSGCLTLELNKGIENYNNVSAQLTYQVHENTLSMKLRVINSSKESVAISPAFHPYFKIEDASEVYLDGERLDLSDSKYLDTDYKMNPESLETSTYIAFFRNENLEKSALWTDNKEQYFCVEPTYNGPTFLDNSGYVTLEPRQEKIFYYEISIDLK